MDALRKLFMEVVAKRDEASRAEKKVQLLEREAAELRQQLKQEKIDELADRLITELAACEIIIEEMEEKERVIKYEIEELRRQLQSQ